LTVYGLAEKAGMSKDTFMKVEDARAVRDSTYLAVDRVLDWPTGTCVGILEEVTPSPLGEAAAVPTQRITEEDIGQAILAGVVANTDLCASEIRAIKDSVIGDLKRRGLL
jgi:hypothetical protein